MSVCACVYAVFVSSCECVIVYWTEDRHTTMDPRVCIDTCSMSVSCRKQATSLVVGC